MKTSAHSRALTPDLMTREVHASITSALNHLIAQTTSEIELTRPHLVEGLRQVRLRDWDLVRKDGQLVCEVYLDKGQSWLQYDDFKDREGHAENQSIVSIDECVAIHKKILATPEFIDQFHDDIQFEVGSAGEEPPLRSAEDFVAAVGLMVRIETWTNVEGRARRKGRLIQVDRSTPGHPVIRIETEGTESPASVALDEIRRAALLLFDPGNFAKA